MLKKFKEIFKNEKKQPESNSTIAALIVNIPFNPVQNPKLNMELNEIIESLDEIIAFVNPKSGGQKGRIVYEKLKNYLGKDHIFDLTQGGPKIGIEKHRNKKNLRILTCGGDGTAGWVLTVLDEFNLPNPPAFGLLPLGTGNDLARTFGWGCGYNDEEIKYYIKNLLEGKIVKLDRWSIQTTPLKNNNEAIRQENETDKLPVNVMNNYFSIGADAKIALDFHLAREKNPELFKSPTYNKIEYVKSYSKDLIIQSCSNTIKSIKLFECDGKSCMNKIKEMNCHSIVFLNIPSYSSGSKPWKDETIQSYSDGKLEILGFQTSDLMFLQIGKYGDPIGQASKIRIITDTNLPMQIDGEAILLTQSEIIIELKNQANMIKVKE